MIYYAGLDLGQKRDHSALVVVERVDHGMAFQGAAYRSILVRYVERMRLGLPYPAVVQRVSEIVRSQELRDKCSLVVDATGVGAPVVDMLREARLGCNLTPVTISGGEGGSGKVVSKQDLMAGVQVLLEKGQLRIGRLKEREQLKRELMDVRMSRGNAGRMRIGADGSGEHDDLVIALALACWRARCRPNGPAGLWAGVRDYDPVLRSHCRLGEPEKTDYQD